MVVEGRDQGELSLSGCGVQEKEQNQEILLLIM